MSSRIVSANRTVWRSADFLPVNWRKAFPNRVTGRGQTRVVESVDCASAIPPDSPAAPFRSGVALRDLDEDLVYRVIYRVDPAGGWASTEFWQDRYKIRHRDVIELAAAGFLDPVIEEGSQVRRYRCRDEGRLKRDPVFKRVKARAAHQRHNRKRNPARSPR